MARFFKVYKICQGLALFLGTCTIIWYFTKAQVHLPETDSNFSTPPLPEKEYPKNIIRIASVVCPKPGDTSLRGELTVLMKSVAISRLLYKIPDDLEFHLLLSNNEDVNYFKTKLQEYDHPMTPAKPTLYVYYADDAVSKYYPSGMLEEQRYPCQYLRIFLPKILEGKDATIYFDTDIIITGNLQTLWNKFSEMGADQIVAIAEDIAEDNSLKQVWFQEGPLVPLQGLNVGVQLMNLTRMRQVGWSEKLMQLYTDYVLKKNNRLRRDQRLTNMVLSFNTGLAYTLPCQFNFWRVYCSFGYNCDSAIEDPIGIHVLHGGANGFDSAEYFQEIFTAYRDFNFGSSTTKSDIVNGLMIPIRNLYSLAGISRGSIMIPHKFCDGYVDKLLFKDVFDSMVD